jgi:Flp pilus assembly protein TadG
MGHSGRVKMKATYTTRGFALTASSRRGSPGFQAQHKQPGQALVEFAFVLPMLLLLALGVIEVGRYAYISILVGNAARAGAAYGAEHLANASSDPTVQAKVQAAATNDFQNNGQTGLSVSSNSTCGCDSNGTISSDTAANCAPTGTPPTCTVGHWAVTIHVTASGTFNALFNYPGIPTSINVSNTASMRVAQE